MLNLANQKKASENNIQSRPGNAQDNNNFQRAMLQVAHTKGTPQQDDRHGLMPSVHQGQPADPFSVGDKDDTGKSIDAASYLP